MVCLNVKYLDHLIVQQRKRRLAALLVSGSFAIACFTQFTVVVPLRVSSVLLHA